MKPALALLTMVMAVASSPAPAQVEPDHLKDKQDVLFAFDDVSIEATRGMKIEMMRPNKHP